MNRLGKHLAIWGSLLQLGIIVGFVVTLIQMGRAMSVLIPSEPTPPDLTSAVEISLRVIAIGMITSTAGGFLTLAALFGCRYRAPWLHSVLSILSLFWFATSPLLGLAIIAYLILDRKSFFQSPDSPSSPPEACDASESGAFH